MSVFTFLIAASLLAACLWSVVLLILLKLQEPCSFSPSDRPAILLLGGDLERERITAALAGQGLLSASERAALAAAARVPPAAAALLADPAAPLLVSSAHGNIGEVMAAHGVPPGRLRIDVTATDTLTNFTTSLPTLRALGSATLLVVTSDYHAARAAALAALLLPGRCAVRRCACLGLRAPASAATASGGASAAAVAETVAARAWSRPLQWAAEAYVKAPRDAARALLWRAAGWDGTSVGRLVHPERFWHLD